MYILNLKACIINETNIFSQYQKNKHPSEHKICQEKNKKLWNDKKGQPTLQGFIEKTTKYKANSQHQLTLDNALMVMIATDMQPCSFVNYKGFNKYNRLSHQSSEGCRFDPCMGLGNDFPEDGA